MPSYRLILCHLRRTATRTTLYRADDTADICEVWRLRDGRLVMSETITAASTVQLWLPAPLGVDVRKICS